MTRYHAVIIDECGQEAGVDVEAKNHREAYKAVHDAYPENRGIVQLESPADTAKRQRRIYERVERELNGDFREWDYEQRYSGG